MSGLTYNEINSFLFENYKQHLFISDHSREMSEHDIEMVSGGFDLSTGNTGILSPTNFTNTAQFAVDIELLDSLYKIGHQIETRLKYPWTNGFWLLN